MIYFAKESRFVLKNGYPQFIINGYEVATGLWNARVNDVRQEEAGSGNSAFAL